MSAPVILGTRGSDLALTQSRTVAQALREKGVDVRLEVIRTEGDISRESLSRLGGVGVFAAALRLAVLDGRCHLAVHSFKDLPTQPVAGLRLGAVPQRAPVGDALCARGGRTLAELEEGARVGTGSIRRAAQLLALRPDLRICDIRGNVPTRLGRVSGLSDGPGDLDAVVLARAGLVRLGLEHVISEIFDVETVMPAPAQGALAVEVSEAASADHPELARALADLDDAPSRAAALAERAVLATLGAGCAAPVGALAHVEGQVLSLAGRVVAIDGSEQVTSRTRTRLGDDAAAEEAGRGVGEELLAAGAGELADLGADREAISPDYFHSPGRGLFGEEPR